MSKFESDISMLASNRHDIRDAEQELEDERFDEGDPRDGDYCSHGWCYNEPTVEVPIVIRLGPFTIWTKYKGYCPEHASKE